jgi:hypothetical protein
MRRHLPADVTINRCNSIEAKAIVNALFIAASNQVEICQSVTQGAQVHQGNIRDWVLYTLNKAAQREALSLEFKVESAAFAF